MPSPASSQNRFFGLLKSTDFPFAPRKFPFFYGWVILAAAVVGTLMSMPGQTMGVGVFTDFLIEATGLNRLRLSTAYMFGTIASSLVLPFSGRLLDAKGSRFVVILAAAGLGSSLILLGKIEGILKGLLDLFSLLSQPVVSFLLMVVVFALMRQFGQGLMTLSSRTMLSKWFERKRGLTTGISGVFISFGFSSSPMFLNWMITRSGWQSASFQLAFITGLLMAIFGWIFYRDNPEECGLMMDGVVVTAGDDNSNNTQRWPEPEIPVPVTQVRRSYVFWTFNAGLGLHALIVTALTFHMASLGEVAGLDRAQVFSLFLPISVVSVSTNLAAGWLSDRIQLKYLLMAKMVALFIGTISMLFIGSMLGKIGLAVGIGMSGGLFACLAAVTWPRYFGRKYLGAIAGLNMATLVFGSAIGPALFGFSQSFFTSYDSAVWLSAVGPVIVLAASFFIKKH